MTGLCVYVCNKNWDNMQKYANFELKNKWIAKSERAHLKVFIKIDFAAYFMHIYIYINWCFGPSPISGWICELLKQHNLFQQKISFVFFKNSKFKI